ncbi:hypothetical protein BaRGS_00016368 [Batillaria attramentaria]|uniref:Peptidase S1 domain-containing protein n=1 Tax=Batillaria attramentaria TaxID=370345 RepID=A0ABD0KZI4_9CAEN
MISARLTPVLTVTPVRAPSRQNKPNLPGGVPMKKHQWPFLVSIVRLWGDNQTDKACGGSVISSNLVLTAAHCFHGEKKETFLVIVGDFDAATHEGPEQYRRVEKVITHPAWDPLTFNHDIAILKLEEQLDLVPGVVEMVPLNLDPRCPPDGLTCVAGGWGQMEENVNGKVYFQIIS